MQNEDNSTHERCNGQPVEGAVQGLIDRLPLLGQLLLHVLVEAVLLHVLVHTAEFVVPAHKEDLRRVGGLQGEEQADDLQLVCATVDPVAVEHIGARLHVAPAVRWQPVEAEEQQQVTQLAMHVAEDLGGRGHAHERGLRLQLDQARLCQRVDVVRLLHLVAGTQESPQRLPLRHPIAVEHVQLCRQLPRHLHGRFHHLCRQGVLERVPRRRQRPPPATNRPNLRVQLHLRVHRVGVHAAALHARSEHPGRAGAPGAQGGCLGPAVQHRPGVAMRVGVAPARVAQAVGEVAHCEAVRAQVLCQLILRQGSYKPFQRELLIVHGAGSATGAGGLSIEVAGAVALQQGQQAASYLPHVRVARAEVADPLEGFVACHGVVLLAVALARAAQHVLVEDSPELQPPHHFVVRALRRRVHEGLAEEQVLVPVQAPGAVCVAGVEASTGRAAVEGPELGRDCDKALLRQDPIF
mmetsp:Transcript_10546/g.32848  ORF Transcript_10546/g.32848 Transcript_10546/m.32848 type:complete len:466 (+) Transcript_10546:571-1968(+)